MREIIASGLASGQADLETLPNGHICGHVISSGFDGLDYEERRNCIRTLLVSKLAPHELLKVSTLLTYTPDEWSVATSDLN